MVSYVGLRLCTCDVSMCSYLFLYEFEEKIGFLLSLAIDRIYKTCQLNVCVDYI